jgi:CO/xanthine dehydrogenase Mo-binding subunit
MNSAIQLRKDGYEKVTGRARYTGDFTLPNMAFGFVVRSERAHATIDEIDLAEAQESEGVLAVVVAADFGTLQNRFGHIVPDHSILATNKVRYVGEPIAVVVAVTYEQAFDAAQKIWITYGDLPEIMTIEDSLESSDLIHEDNYSDNIEGFLDAKPKRSGNTAHEVNIAWGDVDSAFASADHVVETEIKFPMTYAYAMETYISIADFQPGSLHVITSAQHPTMVREELSKILRLPLSAVRVQVPYVGGGYGSKSYTKIEPLASLCSYLVGRPVKISTDVEGAIATTRANNAQIKVRTAVSNSGEITAREFDILMDSGAYCDNSPLVLTKCAHRCFGPYKIPNLKVHARLMYTNTSPASSYRGFGAPQGVLAGEVNLEQIADKVGIDSGTLRFKNLLGPGGRVLPDGRGLDADIGADLHIVIDALQAAAQPGKDGYRRAIGFAVSASDAGAAPISTVMVRMHYDGSVTLMTSATELGQGSKTALAQIVAQELDISLDKVAVSQSDTLSTPYEWTTGASRTTTIAGLATQRACSDLKEKLCSMAQSKSGKDAVAVFAETGLIKIGETERSSAKVIQDWFGAKAGEVAGVGVVRKDGVTKEIPPFWEIGVVGVEVEVNELTGAVSVEHLVTVGDVGHAINTSMVEGQDLGAATQGLGGALYEELIYEGQSLLNPNMVEYRVPRMRDTPKKITSVVVEREDGVGPYGAKGSGEGAMNPIAAAIATAVARAIGVWPTELPITPERVSELLK